MISILGSGFGLYGYMPALIEGCSQKIILLERYRSLFDKRSELAIYKKHIQWVADEDSALNQCDGLVLARRPIDQIEGLKKSLTKPHIERFLLEKPLAQSPDHSTALLEELIQSRKTFRIGYIFRYTSWGKLMLKNIVHADKDKPIHIHWYFMAHHFSHDINNWKRSHELGGGAIRFYGIHMIALLAEIGYREVLLSKSSGLSIDQIEKWKVILTGPNLPNCEFIVDTKSELKQFSIEYSLISPLLSPVCVNLSDPFSEQIKPSNCNDLRVPLLSQLCASLWQETTTEYENYDATIKLWQAIEMKTQFKIRD